LRNQHKHVAYSEFEIPNSGQQYPFATIEKINRDQQIVYTRVRYQCKICKKWYEVKEHIDTVGIVEKFNPPKPDMTAAQFRKYVARRARDSAAKTPAQKKVPSQKSDRNVKRVSPIAKPKSVK
jgi:hypothetical protein